MHEPKPHFRRIAWAALALILAITALAYWPGTRGAFLLDDFPNLVQNSAFENLEPTPGSLLAASLSSDSGPTHRPLAMGSLALNVLAAGGAKTLQRDAGVMKRTNVAIHLLNGILVFLLLRLLLGQYRRLRPETSERLCTGIALLVTASWLLAPINLTAVLYIVQRMTSLAATFSLLGLIAFTAGRSRLYEGRHPARAWLWMLVAALVCTPLAVLSKETGALTLLYAAVIEWSMFGLRDRQGHLQWGVAGYFGLFLVLPAIIGLAWLVPTALHSGAWQMRDFTPGQRLLTEGRVIWHYLWWTLVPNVGALTLFHDAFPVSHDLFHPWSTLPAWIGIAALLGAGIWTRRRYPLVSLGLLWFLAGQVISASFMPLELVFEHRQYLPSLGLYTALFASVMLLAARHERYRRIAISAVLAIVALYGAALGLRSLNWSNPVRQLAITVQDHPDSPRATYAYARLLTITSNSYPKLVPKAFEALEKAASVPHQAILPEATMIILAQRTGRPVPTAWYEEMTEKLQQRGATPGDVSALYSLVHCALREHKPCTLDPLQMQLVFAAALTRNPNDPRLAAIYGNYLLNVAGQPRAARRIFRLLVEKHPGDADYHFDLGVAELACGDTRAAQAQLATLRGLNRLGMRGKQIKSLSDLIERYESTH